jgi:hypothetical protein
MGISWKHLTGLVAVSLIAAGPALAAHGKVGLWNVVSTVQVTLSPDITAQMKKSGVTLPAPLPTTVQMCMSKEEVESNTPPHLDSAATGCDTKLLVQTPQLMRAAITCKGQMKGTGRIEVAYDGAEHYSGSYSFKGTSYGRATNMSTSFKGDWVKADCGKVKPYKLRTQ